MTDCLPQSLPSFGSEGPFVLHRGGERLISSEEKKGKVSEEIALMAKTWISVGTRETFGSS